jgi:hypothetical protein
MDLEPDLVGYIWEGREGKSHFFGRLPERRRNPERITHESVMNWGRMVMGSRAGIKKIYFIKVNE